MPPNWAGSSAAAARTATCSWWAARRTIRAFNEAGELDRLELVVLPVLLGTGVPLSPPGSPVMPLRLLGSERVFPDGSAELVYASEPERAPDQPRATISC